MKRSFLAVVKEVLGIILVLVGLVMAYFSNLNDYMELVIISLVIVILGGYLIYQSFQKKSAIEEANAKANTAIAKQKGIIFIMRILDVIGVIVVLSVGFSGSIAVVIAGAIIVGIAEAVTMNAKGKIKQIAADNVVVDVINETFDDVYYNANQALPREVIRSANFRIPYDNVIGNDYIKGKYQGLSIQSGDIELLEVSIEKDKEDLDHEIKTSSFKGLWLYCDFEKEIPADFVLMKKKKSLIKLNKGSLKTGNEEFDKTFDLYSDHEYETMSFLTPLVMEKLVKLASRTKGRLYISYNKNGEVNVAIDSGYDNFEVGGNANLERLRQKFRSEIKNTTDIIDVLLLIDTIVQK